MLFYEKELERDKIYSEELELSEEFSMLYILVS
jgi:hypothetical protein